jgi:hypothetical protein
MTLDALDQCHAHGRHPRLGEDCRPGGKRRADELGSREAKERIAELVLRRR